MSHRRLCRFAIEVKSPVAAGFTALRNRLAFDYPVGAVVSGNRDFPSLDAPFQTYRWIHFPQEPRDGDYTYRVTMMHMDRAGRLRAGVSATAVIELCNETVPGVVEVGFTRNFASSQAFSERFPNEADRKKILPKKARDGLGFDKAAAPAGVYDWLGGKANDLLARVTDEAVADATVSLDVMVYETSPTSSPRSRLSRGAGRRCGQACAS